MNKNYKLSENDTLSIVIVIMINKLILNIPYYIIQSVGSGTLANIIYIGLIDFIFLLLIIKLMNKFENQDQKVEEKQFRIGKNFYLPIYVGYKKIYEYELESLE